MKVLITGSEGRIGRHLATVLRDEGHDLRGFDVVARAERLRDYTPGDLRDLTAVRLAMQGVDAVVHLGAVPGDRDDGAVVMQTNVMGTYNVLQAAHECGVPRLVYFSSINAQGSVKGLRPPEYLPIDDLYPHHPLTPYQLSKHLGEEICRFVFRILWVGDALSAANLGRVSRSKCAPIRRRGAVQRTVETRVLGLCGCAGCGRRCPALSAPGKRAARCLSLERG